MAKPPTQGTLNHLKVWYRCKTCGAVLRHYQVKIIRAHNSPLRGDLGHQLSFTRKTERRGTFCGPVAFQLNPTYRQPTHP